MVRLAGLTTVLPSGERGPRKVAIGFVHDGGGGARRVGSLSFSRCTLLGNVLTVSNEANSAGVPRQASTATAGTYPGVPARSAEGDDR